MLPAGLVTECCSVPKGFSFSKGQGLDEHTQTQTVRPAEDFKPLAACSLPWQPHTVVTDTHRSDRGSSFLQVPASWGLKHTHCPTSNLAARTVFCQCSSMSSTKTRKVAKCLRGVSGSLLLDKRLYLCVRMHTQKSLKPKKTDLSPQLA